LEVLKIMRPRGEESLYEDREGNDVGRGPRAPQAVHQLRREVQDSPKKVTTMYLRDLKTQLGVADARQYWHPRDFTRRHQARFQRNRGLLRIHYMLSEILGAMMENKGDYAMALTVQASKAVFQASLDDGKWDTAAFLWPFPDPLGGPEFGGQENEMQAVYAYRKALAELKLKAKPPGANYTTADLEEDEASGTPEAGRRRPARDNNKGRGRGTGEAGRGRGPPAEK
jgi:hypothetical protein